MAESDLPLLAARAKKGDRVAFEQIVRCTGRLVYAQIAASVRDRQKAEDLTQETFLAAWKGIATVEAGATGSFVNWLLTLARNTTLDAIKFDSRQKRGGGRSATGDIDQVAAPGTPVDNAELAESRAFALRLLEELPEEYRVPLSMRYLAGADYHAIRGALGLTDGALRGLLTRGMAILRERMRVTNDKVTSK